MCNARANKGNRFRALFHHKRIFFGGRGRRSIGGEGPLFSVFYLSFTYFYFFIFQFFPWGAGGGRYFCDRRKIYLVRDEILCSSLLYDPFKLGASTDLLRYLGGHTQCFGLEIQNKAMWKSFINVKDNFFKDKRVSVLIGSDMGEGWNPIPHPLGP